MALVTLIEGNVDIKKMLPKFKLIEKRNEMAFLVRGESIPRVMNAVMIRDNDFLKWVCQNTRYDTFIIFPKKVPTGFSKTGLKLKVNDIQTIKGDMPSKDDLFKILDAIAFSTDRAAVYNMIEKSNMQYSIMLFLTSNIDKLTAENQFVVAAIDMFALAKNTRNTNEMLAFSIKPQSGRIFWRYKWPKKEDKEEVAEDA